MLLPYLNESKLFAAHKYYFIALKSTENIKKHLLFTTEGGIIKLGEL